MGNALVEHALAELIDDRGVSVKICKAHVLSLEHGFGEHAEKTPC